VLITLYHSPNTFPSDEIKGGELRGLYCADEQKRKADMLVWGRLKEGDHLKDLGVGGNDNIDMDIKYIGGENMDCFHLAQNKDQLWVLVTTLMKLQVP
jgi:hypothetical protein